MSTLAVLLDDDFGLEADPLVNNGRLIYDVPAWMIEIDYGLLEHRRHTLPLAYERMGSIWSVWESTTSSTS